MSHKQMDDRAKLKVLIDHWIEHNMEHAREFTTWADKVGQPEVRKYIEEAARQMEKANDRLLAALERLEED